MSRGIRIGSKAGYPVVKTGSLNLSSISITPSTSYQVIQAPSGSAYNSVTVAAVTSAIDSNIIPQNIKKDVEILGVTGTYIPINCNVEKQVINRMLESGIHFIGTEGILSLDDFILAYAYINASFINQNLNFLDLIEIKENSLFGTFKESNITTFTFNKLSKIGSNGLNMAFASCNSLTDISFLALTSSSVIANNAFDNMVSNCVNVTIHFPSNLNPSIISSLTGYPSFGGINTTLAFDLPASN